MAGKEQKKLFILKRIFFLCLHNGKAWRLKLSWNAEVSSKYEMHQMIL